MQNLRRKFRTCFVCRAFTLSILAPWALEILNPIHTFMECVCVCCFFFSQQQQQVWWEFIAFCTAPLLILAPSIHVALKSRSWSISNRLKSGEGGRKKFKSTSVARVIVKPWNAFTENIRMMTFFWLATGRSRGWCRPSRHSELSSSQVCLPFANASTGFLPDGYAR